MGKKKKIPLIPIIGGIKSVIDLFKGIKESKKRRTIGRAVGGTMIITFAVTNMTANGMTWEGIALCGIGAAITIFSK